MRVLHKDEYTTVPPSEEGFSYIITIPGCDPDCPFCQERLTAHDWNKRYERCLDGTVKEYRVEDRICLKCHKMQRLLPDFLVPHKHYGSEAIEEMISNDMDNTFNKYPDTGNEFTVKRCKEWWNAMKPYFLAVVMSLAEMFGNAYQKAVGFREIIHDVTNSCRWSFPTHFVSMPG